VDDDRHAQPPGGEVRRQRDVPAEADDDVGPVGKQDLGRPPDGLAQKDGQAEQVAGGPAGQRHRRDQRKFVPAFRNQAGLEPARRPERCHIDGRVVPSQGVGRGEGGLDVACGTAAGEHHAH